MDDGMDETIGARRRFLKMVAALSVEAAACSSASGVAPQNVGDVAAGKASDLAVGALRNIGAEPVCIGRDGGGIYAMTLTCTHQGCDGSVLGTTVACPCHGSTFDRNGNVTGGPAPSPLAHFQVSADAQGNLTVHTGAIVDAGTRLQV
jgi:Rieske Fe-S protein